MFDGKHAAKKYHHIVKQENNVKNSFMIGDSFSLIL